MGDLQFFVVLTGADANTAHEITSKKGLPDERHNIMARLWNSERSRRTAAVTQYKSSLEEGVATLNNQLKEVTEELHSIDASEKRRVSEGIATLDAIGSQEDRTRASKEMLEAKVQIMQRFYRASSTKRNIEKRMEQETMVLKDTASIDVRATTHLNNQVTALLDAIDKQPTEDSPGGSSVEMKRHKTVIMHHLGSFEQGSTAIWKGRRVTMARAYDRRVGGKAHLHVDDATNASFAIQEHGANFLMPDMDDAEAVNARAGFYHVARLAMGIFRAGDQVDVISDDGTSHITDATVQLAQLEGGELTFVVVKHPAGDAGPYLGIHAADELLGRSRAMDNKTIDAFLRQTAASPTATLTPRESEVASSPWNAMPGETMSVMFKLQMQHCVATP
jgi:hypothetical protein